MQCTSKNFNLKQKKMVLSLGSIILLSSLCVALFTIGSFLNVALLFILIRSRQNMKMISSLYLVSLSIAQLIGGLYESPYYIISICVKLPPPPQEQYRLACRISIFTSYFISAVKILNLTVMSLDRFIAIIFPFAYGRIITKRTASFSVAFAWIFPLFVTLPLLAIYDWTNYEGGSGYVCGVQFQITGVIYTMMAGLLTITMPCLIMLITNVKVFLIARRQQRQITNERAKLGERSVGTIASQSHEIGLEQRTDFHTDGLASQLSTCDQNSLCCFHCILRRNKYAKKSNRNMLQSAKSLNYDAGSYGKHNSSTIVSNQREPKERTRENEGTENIPSTEMYVLRSSASFSSISSSSSNVRCNQKHQADVGKFSDNTSVCAGHKLYGDDKVNAIRTVPSNGTNNSETEERLRDKESSKVACNCGVAALADPSSYDEHSKDLGCVLAQPMSDSVENGRSANGDFDTPEKPSDTSRFSLSHLLERRRGKKSMSSTESDPSFSWSVVSSTLLLALAFCLTYMPFLITRFVESVTSINFSDEAVTYTAVLTTLGNLINPCIVLSTRRNLKSDFTRIVCRRRLSVDE